MRSFFILEDGRTLGPYSVEEIIAYFEQGRIGESAFAREGESDPFRPLRDVVPSIPPPKRNAQPEGKPASALPPKPFATKSPEADRDTDIPRWFKLIWVGIFLVILASVIGTYNRDSPKDSLRPTTVASSPPYQGTQEEREAMMVVEDYLRTIVRRPDTLRCSFAPVVKVGNYHRAAVVYTCLNELGGEATVSGEFYVKGGSVCFPPLPVTESTP